MRLRQHLIFGGAAALAAYHFWGPWRALLFYGSAVLIDADHYWDYLWRSSFKDWSGWRMFRYYYLIENKLKKTRLKFPMFSMLHTFEFFCLIYLSARFLNYEFFIVIFWGIVFHILLDFISMTYEGLAFARAYSITEYFIRKKISLAKGIHPERFYKEIFDKSLAGRGLEL